jgi:hypothetical protein
MAQTATPVQLKQQTLKSFSAYIRDAEAAMEQTLGDGSSFLWSDVNSERVRQVRGGQVVAQFWSGHGPVKVPNGLIHDWIGAAFIPGTTVKDVLAWCRTTITTTTSTSPTVRVMRKKAAQTSSGFAS